MFWTGVNGSDVAVAELRARLGLALMVADEATALLARCEADVARKQLGHGRRDKPHRALQETWSLMISLSRMSCVQQELMTPTAGLPPRWMLWTAFPRPIFAAPVTAAIGSTCHSLD